MGEVRLTASSCALYSRASQAAAPDRLREGSPSSSSDPKNSEESRWCCLTQPAAQRPLAPPGGKETSLDQPSRLGLETLTLQNH